jgi:hypothetical protein
MVNDSFGGGWRGAGTIGGVWVTPSLVLIRAFCRFGREKSVKFYELERGLLLFLLVLSFLN